MHTPPLTFSWELSDYYLVNLGTPARKHGLFQIIDKFIRWGLECAQREHTPYQFEVFKPLSYNLVCKASSFFSHQTRWHNTKKNFKKTIQFHRTSHSEWKLQTDMSVTMTWYWLIFWFAQSQQQRQQNGFTWYYSSVSVVTFEHILYINPLWTNTCSNW